MTVKVSTDQAEKAIKQVERATKKATDIDTSKATMGIKDQTMALGGWTDRLKAMSEQSSKAGQSVGGLFQRLDAGRLIVAGAAAGMVAYAKSALTMAEASRLNIDLLKEQLGAQSDAAMSFIGAGDKGRGTSSATRGGLMAYMSMTGYKDEGRNEKMITGLEKVMASKEGAYLKNFGINDEKDLLSQLASGNINETSDLGRFVKERSAQFFSPNAMGIEKTKVANDFAKQGKVNVSQEVIDAEARRRLAAKAVEDISGGVTEDKDSYRVGMRDLTKSFQTLNAGIGDAVRPAAAVILQFLTTLTRLLSEHPKITTLGAAFVVLGAALATVGAVGGLFVSAITPLYTLTKSQTIATLAHAGAETLRATATKAATIAQAAMNLVMSANPLGIAIIAIAALVAGLYLLEKKFGIVTKAVQAFKDLWASLKGGDLGGALKGGLGLALKLSPIGMIAGFAEALNPSKRVQDEILYVLKKLKELWDGFTRWLDGIWTTISKLLDPLLKLKESLQALKEKFFGKELTKENISEGDYAKLTAWLGKQKDEMGGKYDYAAETSRAAVDLALSGVNPAEITKEQLPPSLANATPEAIEKFKRAVDKLEKHLEEGAPGIIPSASSLAAGAIKGLDAKTAEAAKKTEENLDKGLPGSAAADWSVLSPLEYLYAAGKGALGYAEGGEVTKTGWAKIHEGEPIVPAEVARSSVVIDSLKALASGGPAEKGGGGIHIGDIIINSNSGDGRTLAQQFREALERELSDFELKHRQEAIYKRANRGFMA